MSAEEIITDNQGPGDSPLFQARTESTPETAAHLLFHDPRAAVHFNPSNETEARRGVDELARLFETMPGLIKQVMDSARAGAETLSSDRLQGLSEIIQNADDAAATYVEFQIIAGYLLVRHNGRPVTLSDVLAMATPWLSNKADDIHATGRFGIGLMTLRTLSDVLDVHSGHYHVRLGQPTITAIDATALPVPARDPAVTVLCLPLQETGLNTATLVEWFSRWDDGALLFLRHVKQVSVLGPDGTAVVTLGLAWSEDEPATCLVDGNQLTVQRRHAHTADGRTWLVHSTAAPAPAEVKRASKASGSTVPLGLALPLHHEPHGAVYAGLPVVDTVAPIRVNAQFDPTTSRSELASTEWNAALLPLLADLWVEVLEDLFAEAPTTAWHVVPLPSDADDGRQVSVVGELERLLLDRARRDLAGKAGIRVGDLLTPLAELAVEDTELEDVIEPAEVASLAGLAAALPNSARDAAGRWRLVLDDWRQAGAPIPPSVTTEAALVLLDDVNRSTTAVIRLTAVALDAGLAEQLTGLPCAVTTDGMHVVPPVAASVQALLATESPLAEQLGVGVRLAPDHLADNQPAKTVLAWLRQTGAVIDNEGNEHVVRRLAAAGSAGRCLDDPLTDEQLRALRGAFEQLHPEQRQTLGPDVGRAIRIAAFSYKPRGGVEYTSARPVDLYLSRVIDREPDSFAAAADRTPGLLWTHNRYAEQLRSTLGRGGGLGPQRFLGLLGVERTPRLVRHPALYQRFSSDRRKGLPRTAAGSPPQRGAALRTLDASYTLDDLDSPDLRAVAINIAKERKATPRRRRATALLGALSRAWDRLADKAEVDTADDYYSWILKGPIHAFWLWATGAIAWLDDTHGRPRRPLDLRLKTPGTIAVHGSAASGYLRPEFDTPNRRDILAALGVAGEPSTRDLVEQLRSLRALDPVPDILATDAAIIYQALADRLTTRTTVAGDLTEKDLRTAFASGEGLLHTNLGWCAPSKVLTGRPVFGQRRAFVPQVPRTERLWNFLRIPEPSLADCLHIIGQVARTRRPPDGEDILVSLETLRLIDENLAKSAPESPLTRRLAKLALFTSLGWTTRRPVYAIDDPSLVEGLGGRVRVWEPGGDVSQFTRLLAPLRITHLNTANTTVINPETAHRDEVATAALTSAVSILQEDLARNDPQKSGSLSIGWDRLRDFEVRVDPDLRVRVDGLVGEPPIDIEVAAKVDANSAVLFLRAPHLLRQVDTGGRAIASLFTAVDRRQIAQAWLAACIAAEEGRKAQQLQLAEQRAAEQRDRTAKEMVERKEAMRQHIASHHTSPSRTRPVNPVQKGHTEPRPTPTPHTKPRTLVDPTTLAITNIDGHPTAQPEPHRQSTRRGSNTTSLPQPDRTSRPPRGSTSAPDFTALDKESIGLELARLVLGGDADEITDLRTQRGVGADAIDSLERFYELKVHLGDEPDTIQLEETQIRRALSTRDFFLVIVSNVEATNARPQVRIIVDPVRQLTMTPSSAVQFTGVRSAEHSLVYHLAPISNASRTEQSEQQGTSDGPADIEDEE